MCIWNPQASLSHVFRAWLGDICLCAGMKFNLDVHLPLLHIQTSFAASGGGGWVGGGWHDLKETRRAFADSSSLATFQNAAVSIIPGFKLNTCGFQDNEYDVTNRTEIMKIITVIEMVRNVSEGSDL